MENLELHKKISEEKNSRPLLGNKTVFELIENRKKYEERIKKLEEQSDTLTEVEYKNKFDANSEDADFIKGVEIVNLELSIKDIDSELKRRELLN